MPRSNVVRGGTLLAMTTALGAGGLAAQEQTAPETTSTAPPTPASFAPVAKDIMPAVVSITSQRAPTEAENPMSGLPDNHPLREFFDQFGDLPGNVPGPEGPQGRPEQAAASGFIIGAEGFVVTNNHVVEPADSVSIALSDEREFDAEVIGTDPRTDLALLKIDADTDLPELE